MVKKVTKNWIIRIVVPIVLAFIILMGWGLLGSDLANYGFMDVLYDSILRAILVYGPYGISVSVITYLLTE